MSTTSAATSGSNPSLMVTAAVVCGTCSSTAPSATPSSATAAATDSVTSTSCSRRSVASAISVIRDRTVLHTHANLWHSFTSMAVLAPTPAGLAGRDLLSIDQLDLDHLIELLDLADHLKMLQGRGVPHRLLPGRTLAMIFQKASTRTRVSFEVGIGQ